MIGPYKEVKLIDFGLSKDTEGNTKSLIPMKLKDIAEELKMDISTISRSTRGKYVDTPYGIFELKSFFSDGYIIKSGEEISTKIIKDFLKQLIDDEDKKSPLTDSHLAEKLNIKGYPVARRTVAKYREDLDYPVSRLRKELKCQKELEHMEVK